MSPSGRFRLLLKAVQRLVLVNWFLAVLAACSGASGVPSAATPTDGLRSTVLPPTEPVARPTTPGAATPSPLFYNLPPATLTCATGLYITPNRPELIVSVMIPAGETVYVMGRNRNGSHLRVVWNTGVGWVPVSFTNWNGDRDRLGRLPVFSREPPGCVIPIATQFSVSNTWTSDREQKIAVVVDLFRTRYGDFPPSSMLLTVNGTKVESSRREIVERGQFSLKDVVFTLPAPVRPKDRVGYLLETSSDEPLSFMATIFSIPQGCVWER
ncbi:MAG: hypothetical protein K6V36_00445 [Anaerolineae bacterium]|nr:hypothetical protein [Anaerolineae bacterium]